MCLLVRILSISRLYQHNSCMSSHHIIILMYNLYQQISYISYYQNRSYVIPILTNISCVLYLSPTYINKLHTCLHQQISYMSHYHICHTYITEYSTFLLIRIFLCHTHFCVSPRWNDIYVQTI